jgi:hypothetical protein
MTNPSPKRKGFVDLIETLTKEYGLATTALA